MRLRRVVLGFLLLALLLFLFHEPLFRRAGYALVRSDPQEKADIVVVLAGGSDGERILKGGELVREGYAPLALMSGPAVMYGHTECEFAIPFAVNKGYPSSYFACLPNIATSTREEAVFIVAELKRRDVKKFLLVTSEYHTARAGRVFESEAQGLQLRVIPAVSPGFDINNWWKTRDGIKNVYMEWSKTLAYFFDF